MGVYSAGPCAAVFTTSPLQRNALALIDVNQRGSIGPAAYCEAADFGAEPHTLARSVRPGRRGLGEGFATPFFPRRE